MYRKDNMFMISCPARSGSTMLVHLLRSHPEIWCNGEVFGDGPVSGLLGVYAQKTREHPDFVAQVTAERDRDPGTFFYKFAVDAQGRKVAGFKLKTNEMMARSHRKIRKIVLREKDLKVLFLHRENLLDRFISHQISLKTGVTMIQRKEERPHISPIRLDPKACEADFAEVLACEERVHELFREHRSIDLDYDRLVSGDEAYTNRICDFLEVSRQPLQTPTLKVIDQDRSQLVENYDQVARYFAGSKYEKFLGPAHRGQSSSSA